MNLSISSTILAELQSLAFDGLPLEICGILFGQKDLLTGFRSTNNVAENPSRHFEIDPSVLINVERAARETGPQIMGYYHSHPTGDIRPSQTDADNAAPDGRIWLIINGKRAAAWQAVDDGEVFGRFSPITLDCVDSNGQTALHKNDI